MARELSQPGPNEGDLSPLQAVARQAMGSDDYQGRVTQDVYHAAGHPRAWNGAGWYARDVWTCQHSHYGPRGLEDAQACARRQLDVFLAIERERAELRKRILAVLADERWHEERDFRDHYRRRRAVLRTMLAAGEVVAHPSNPSCWHLARYEVRGRASLGADVHCVYDRIGRRIVEDGLPLALAKRAALEPLLRERAPDGP